MFERLTSERKDMESKRLICLCAAWKKRPSNISSACRGTRMLTSAARPTSSSSSDCAGHRGDCLRYCGVQRFGGQGKRQSTAFRATGENSETSPRGPRYRQSAYRQPRLWRQLPGGEQRVCPQAQPACGHLAKSQGALT